MTPALINCSQNYFISMHCGCPSPLLWSSGADIGTPFQYPLGGVAGFTAGGNLVIAGFGSIVEVDPSSGTIVKTLDPAGTSAFYGIIYEGVNEEVIAVEFPVTFGDPLVFHASAMGFATLPAQSFFTAVLLVLFLMFGSAFFVRKDQRDRRRRGKATAISERNRS